MNPSVPAGGGREILPALLACSFGNTVLRGRVLEYQFHKLRTYPCRGFAFEHSMEGWTADFADLPVMRLIGINWNLQGDVLRLNKQLDRDPAENIPALLKRIGMAVIIEKA